MATPATTFGVYASPAKSIGRTSKNASGLWVPPSSAAAGGDERESRGRPKEEERLALVGGDETNPYRPGDSRGNDETDDVQYEKCRAVVTFGQPDRVGEHRKCAQGVQCDTDADMTPPECCLGLEVVDRHANLGHRRAPPLSADLPSRRQVLDRHRAPDSQAN